MYEAHLFVCTNGQGENPDPDAKKPRCGWKNSETLRRQVKEMCLQKYGKTVRVNSAGCLGQCEHGIAAVLYPAGKWELNLTSESTQKLCALVASAISDVSE